MLRFGCSQLVIERLDPLVNPGSNPSSHMHQIVGGDAFNASMPYQDIPKQASCTTCHFKEDLSNYWTANLYFKARNGTYKRVPQIANQFNDPDNGGITVYYTSAGPNKTVAFRPGFRMLTGDASRRTSENLGKNTQQCYRCFTEPNFGGSMYSPCMDPVLDTDHFPTRPCAGGIRSNIIFPQCWDGINLDSPNHRDHVAHTIGKTPPSFSVVSGQCPESHPVKIPQVMLEVMWDTRAFNNPDEWPEDGSQPFVLSTGDSTGYGQHGDYVFGWQNNSLQIAMDNQCYLRNCTQLTELAASVKNRCNVPDTVGEDIDGWMTHLPGGITAE
ncbi:uncharacterized protein EI97DRAFT_491631 [Westerdykella ornata]|uniref:DUF1996 domain-containing protein n=1 Tax=Westerdykella ornata TaxID=318751 RepID=A0A6A6JYM7_WESOR|nr:uncharacterized protein EI97DRAFT_491631 [Westerdykella ornata]KAF2280139.1 hypothetical protein EI97DRAFT_491631 [Westerdykella ornata]